MAKTIVTILGHENKEPNQPKKIEFLWAQNRNKIKPDFFKANCKPSSWEHVELVSLSPTTAQLDCMFAYNGTDRANGQFYLGNFNDGVV